MGVRGMRLVAVLCAMALLACSDDPSSDDVGTAVTEASGGAPGVEVDTITVSAVYGRSGPYGEVAQRLYDVGFQTWVDDVNARGGINGRTVVVKQVDSPGTAEGGVSACREVQGNGSYVAIALDAHLGSSAFADCMNDAGIVTFGAFTALDPSWDSVYASQPLGTQFGRGLARFLQGPVGAADAKIGVIYLHEAYAESQRDGFLDEADELGLDIADVESVEPNQPSFTPTLQKMRDAGVSHVALFVAAEVLGIQRDAASLDYRPEVSGVLWPSLDLFAQTSGGLLSGAWGLRHVAALDSPAFAEFKELATKYGNSIDPATDGSAFLFYGDGLIMERVLTEAGEAPTATSLRSGIESIEGYDNGVTPEITWGPGLFEGAKALFPAKCCSADLTWEGLGDARADF